MQPKGIFLLFGVALFAGWSLPETDLMAPANDAAVRASAVPDTGVAESAFSDAEVRSGQGGDVVLARHANGHFYADVDVNGTEIRFMVDTGATGLALTADDAEALGLSWDDRDLKPVGRGVGGRVFGKPVSLRSVSIGDIEASDIEAVIIPTGLDVSLLGQSFLSKAGSVTIENDEMLIRS